MRRKLATNTTSSTMGLASGVRVLKNVNEINEEIIQGKNEPLISSTGETGPAEEFISLTFEESEDEESDEELDEDSHSGSGEEDVNT